MTQDKKYLDEVYKTSTADEQRALYDAWADTYDADLDENGYATPARCAALLAAHVSDKSRPVLDFACGTGLSGKALADAGFTTIDGTDISSGMLERAEKLGIYRTLTQVDPGEAPAHGSYGAIAAMGAISTGAAEPQALDTLIDALAPGGLLVVSYNSHTLDNPAYTERMAEVQESKARLVATDEGDHLPGLGLTSMVYLLERV